MLGHAPGERLSLGRERGSALRSNKLFAYILDLVYEICEKQFCRAFSEHFPKRRRQVGPIIFDISFSSILKDSFKHFNFVSARDNRYNLLQTR